MIAEGAKSYKDVTWTYSDHNLDFIFEKNGIGFGIEVKNTLGYLDVDEFVTKIRLAIYIGVKPVFAVRALPKTWAQALIRAGGYAMIMGFQFYPWAHKALAKEIQQKLMLPVDTPKEIQLGTMQRFENWIIKPPDIVVQDEAKVHRILFKIEMSNKPKH